MHLVFLLEELSAKNALDRLLPQIIPGHVTYDTIPHQGKSDLIRSIPIKIRSWKSPNTYFIVLHDQDLNNCHTLKNNLVQLCRDSGRNDVLIRIACYELEAWYFGDLDAVGRVFPKFRADSIRDKRKYRQPDNIVKPSEVLRSLIPEFSKGKASKTIPGFMKIEQNTSHSFRIFIKGVRNILENYL